MNPVHARISKEWRRRMIFLFLMLFGSGIWFFVDGYLLWPAEAKRHVIYKQIGQHLIANGEARELSDAAVKAAWETYAQENNFPKKIPKARSPGEIKFQVWAGWILFSSSIIFAAWVAWNHTLSVRTEGDWVIGASGQRVHLDSIVEIDRRKWTDKGIAYAIYEADGKQRRLTLDDHKFLGCEAIILEAERRIAARAGATTGKTMDETGNGETDKCGMS